MSNKELRLNHNVQLIRHDRGVSPTEICLEYWLGFKGRDVGAEVEIDKEMAIEIVEFLTEAFRLNEEIV